MATALGLCAAPAARATNDATLPLIKLSPQVRSEPLSDPVLASVAPERIRPFLVDMRVVQAAELDGAPRIAAAADARTLLGPGEVAWVRGDLGDGTRFDIVRDLRPLIDPDDRTVLGWEARVVGRAERLLADASDPSDRSGRSPMPAAVRLTHLRLEAAQGDLLVPAAAERDLHALVPKAPPAGLNGRIVAVLGEGLQAAQHQVVALNRGRQEGVVPGHILAAWHERDKAANLSRRPSVGTAAPSETWPSQRVGRMIVFRVFDQVAYALVLDASAPLRRGDRFTAP